MSPTKPKEPSQSEKFIAAARGAECNEDEARFEATLKVMGKSEAKTVVHASDCATHDAPAFKTGACDCGATTGR